jgi:transcriptional regulator with XRE-family HTH domain
MKNLTSKKSYRASPIQLKLFKTRMNNALSRNLRDYIEENHLSKLAFAKIMKKDPAIVSRWLSGNHNFTIETLCEIAFKTRTPITELLDCNYLFKGYWTNPEFTSLCERVN